MYLIKKILLLIILLLGYSNFETYASNNSPYSFYGLGDGKNTRFAHSAALGGLSYGISNPLSINYYNPASYQSLNLTTLETGLTGFIRKMSDADSTQVSGNTRFAYLAAGFPVNNKCGLVFGLLPYSWKEYSTELEDVNVAKYKFNGNGGLSQFFIGSAYQVVKNFSLGVNANYLFGPLKDQTIIEFPDSADSYNLRKLSKTDVGGFYFNYGLQYSTNIREDLLFTLGATFTNKMKVAAVNHFVADRFEYTSTGNIFVQDTIILSDNSKIKKIKGNLIMPTQGGIGFSFSKKQKYLFGGDFSYGKWSEYKFFDEPNYLKNSWGFGMGGEYTPSAEAVGNYFKKITYVAGYKYFNTEWFVNDQQIKEHGINFGVVLPLIRAKSKIVCGIEAGKRGTLKNDLVKEYFAVVNFGFTLNDKWFLRRKID